MKQEQVPQDPSGLKNFTREVCYATDQAGNYVTQLSTGWEVKSTALSVAWQDIEQAVNEAWQQVKAGKASPILFFMKLRLMDTKIVSDYTGFWQFQVRRHLNPAVFNKLSAQKLARYAAAFNVSVAELKTMEVHEG